MKALTVVSVGATTVFACGTGCATSATTFPAFGASSLPVASYAPLPTSTLPYISTQPLLGGGFPSQPFVQGGLNAQPSFLGSSSLVGSSFGNAGSSLFSTQYLGQGSTTYSSGSLFSANKPWQASSQNVQGSVPSSWQNSPSSVWTPTQPSQQGQTQVQGQDSRPVNPSLAGRKPGEQLQITKCRSAQSCEKCRQLNCYWDSTGRIVSRCIALGLESSNIPVEAGQASNLGYCPTQGQQGFLGVNWLAIENSGAAVPNLEGMSDASIQQWLSSIPNYNPDATDSNYPAGTAFRDLLPTAASAYASGKIPSTTPWISFFDSLSQGYTYDGGYSYDSYSYDSLTPSLGAPNFAGSIPSFGSSISNFGVGVGAPSIIGGLNTNFGGSSLPGSNGCGSCGR